MVIQVVKVSIRADQRDRWLELVRANASQTRDEGGCEDYRVCENVESPGEFVLVEEWTDLEAQYRHFRAPEFGALMAKLGDVLAGPPDVSIHEVKSTQTLDEALEAAGVS
jgi:quinol monooxygenase YgiN